MSLRRRITLATTLAVAVVALLVGLFGYLGARSHMISDTRQQLTTLADSFNHRNQGNGGGAPTPGGGGFPHHRYGTPTPPQLGGPTGYFQVVDGSGVAVSVRGGTPELPVNSTVREIAQSGRGTLFFSATVKGTHVEVLTQASPFTHTAIEVALPLTSVDRVLHELLLTYAVLVGLGILIAGVIGALVARAALAPINRFSAQTEAVTSELHRPRRLEETGASELKRLAGSFNQTLDALERSIQAQRHLIADASHELRTPMAALRSNIQIFMEADRLPEEDRLELQASIIAELDELTQLVADVLDLARGAAPSDHIEAVELDAVVGEAVRRARRRAPALTFEAELEPTVIENAPERIARAVSNVIDNACKWSPPDGLIEITLSGGRLRVRDHGPGFKQADLAHVFDRFYRADEARRMPGSGLGLAIVRQAAEAFGGSVRAANAPDGGAEIEIVFGSRPPAGLGASPPEPAAAAAVQNS